MTRERRRDESTAIEDASLLRRLRRGVARAVRPRRAPPPMGAHAERLVAKELARRRYKVLAKNFSTRYGEIDIVARKGRTIAFVEVKGRSRADIIVPGDAVNPRKQKRIIRAAKEYLSRNHMDEADVRFDVAEVVFATSGPSYDVHILEDAFTEEA